MDCYYINIYIHVDVNINSFYADTYDYCADKKTDYLRNICSSH